MNNKQYLLRPCTWIYVFLLILTVITWYIGKSGMSGIGISLTVLGFALIKGHLIGDYFMGLKAIKGIWRWIIFVWLFIPGGLVTYAFWAAQ